MTIQEKKKAASCKPGRAMSLLRGEDLELLSRELSVVASTLSLWREHFLTAGQTALKIKKGQFDVRDEQINRIKKKVGDPNEHVKSFVSNKHTCTSVKNRHESIWLHYYKRRMSKQTENSS
ncbi:MAG: hypothetical protein ACYTEW_26055 [Planctomycetota bacterium]|jgi:hypothetical protein